MKTKQLLAAVSLLLVGCTVSYKLGQYSMQKHYDAACRMSDLIRCYSDNLAEDTLMQDWGCFDELCGIFLWDDAVGSYIHLEDYTYCY